MLKTNTISFQTALANAIVEIELEERIKRRNIRNSLLGFAIGDAMGVPIEFKKREQLIKNPITKMTGFGTHDMPAGCWSDDTSMTIATMDSIVNKKEIDYKDIMECFYEWFVNYKYTACNFRFDIGGTCLNAIINYSKNNKEPLECGLEDIDSNGNGSLMRMLPIAYYCYHKFDAFNCYSYDRDDAIRENENVIELVKNISSLTHRHEISVFGCYLYVKLIIMLLQDMEIDKAYKELQKGKYEKYFDKDVISKYDRILKNDISKYDLNDIKSSGYIVDTLEAVLWIIFNTDNFKHAIVGAVNLGDDTDTIGAIVGSIAGMLYEVDTFPKEWVEKLMKKDYLLEIADKYNDYLVEIEKTRKEEQERIWEEERKKSEEEYKRKIENGEIEIDW